MDALDQEQWPALFPDKPAGSGDEAARRMGGLLYDQSADERLHFSLSAPLGWRWRPANEAPDPRGLLVSLVRDVRGARGAHVAAEIAVFADDVPREVSPAEWTAHRLEQGGHALWAKREAYTPIGAMADLLTRRETPGGALIARTNMAKDGARIFTITCEARAEDYPALAHDFFVTLASFKLLHPERAPLAEALASYCYLTPAVIGFSYPASWELVEEALTDAVYDVRIDSERERGGEAAGSIYVSARLNERPRKLLSDFLGRLQREGARFGDRPALASFPPPSGFIEASTMTARGALGRDGEAIEVRAAALVTAKATVLVALCGPTRARKPFDWMAQSRAFEIVRDTAYAV